MAFPHFGHLDVLNGRVEIAVLQLTADALGIPVWAGPVEATAMGNILVQAMAAGEIANLDALRDIVRHSVTPKVFKPR